MYDGPIREPKAPVIGYGGAAGGGKTDAFLMLGVIICHAFKGARVVFMRRTFAELEGPDGAINRSIELFSGVGTYNETKHRWTFDDTGSQLYFGHCQHEKDRTKYQGNQINVLLIDEATHFTWMITDYLITRNRSVVPGLKPFAAMASNPGNIGHVWYSDLFDIHDLSGGAEGPHQQIKHRLTPNGKYEDVYFIPAKLEDNQVLMKLDPDYERKLEDRGEDLVEALRWGNWQVFAGQAFRTWRRDRHVIEPAKIPAHWAKWRALDWGYVKPFCCLWLTMNPDSGRVYVYRELYIPGLTDRQQARLILHFTPGDENIVTTYADPNSYWTRKTRSENNREIEYTTADVYAEEGVILSRANNDRLDGKRKVDRLLADLPDGRPGLQVFSTCKSLIKEVPNLVYDDRQVEDVDSDQDDHAYDALRYGLTNYKFMVPETSKGKETYDNPLERFGARM